MPFFFAQKDYFTDGFVHLSGEDASHIARTLRMKPGDALTVGDGEGRMFACCIERLAPDAVYARVLEEGVSQAEPSLALCLYTAWPKGDRAELIVQKAVELGASEIVFFMSQRCVARPDARAATQRIARLQKIALEAAKQSERGRVPCVRGMLTFEEMLAEAAKNVIPLFFYERGGRPVREQIAGRSFESAAAVSGPEGGFTPDELAQAERAGLLITSLGPRILRCETAPICACAVLMYASGAL